MRPSENVPLAPLTTFGIGGAARRLLVAERDEDVIEAVRDADGRKDPVLVLGGGSNLLVADEGFPGTVVRLANLGLTRTVDDQGRVLVTASAGESWDGLVHMAAEEGLAGVECLAGIPGLVGATPMQNVGAYGQEVGDTIVSLRALDRRTAEVVTFQREDCAFAYRSSVFRGKDRHVILSVTFALPRAPHGESRPLRYAELTKALGIEAGGSAPLRTVRDTVVALRRKKGMVVDAADADSRSAGSFFTNPIVDGAALADLEARAGLGAGETMPRFPEEGGRTKLSAAWLIERAGFRKGFTKGRAGISGKHALALVNRGGATAGEVVALAREIQAAVQARFGVLLENEPVFVGVRL